MEEDEVPLQLDRERFMAYLRQSGMTITAACERAHLSRSTLNNHLYGPPREVGPKMARALYRLFPFPDVLKPLVDEQVAS